ncbi:serine/threonine-protein phosphatase [Streptomyces albofaciens JCM 4342]|uniref:PP2C family protein-serine/threonine phosphatase n=1 Tax=Streptomyces albofaciens TaxID=66866 RepID=UPI00123B42B5|nr:PP2C family protein-serine/threonine phosphatase [Streptomyces albofaciens]KAA6220677.1 serine/threonine-protein phosphatase [Streptomyces albofaciens JCM 4342]
MAGIEPALPAPTHTAESATAPAPADTPPEVHPEAHSQAHSATCSEAVQDRLAGWISDLTTLHDLTERLARAQTLEAALRELLRAGACLVGARRGLVVLEPRDGRGPDTTIGLGLGQADIGHIETVPRRALSFGRILDGLPEPDVRGRDTRGPDVRDPDVRDPDVRDPDVRERAPHDHPRERRDRLEAHQDGGQAPPTPPDGSLSAGSLSDGAPLGGAPSDGSPSEGAPSNGSPSYGAPSNASGCVACGRGDITRPDIPGEPGLDPRLREVAARLGYAASYAVPLDADPVGRFGAAVWLYDEPAEPTERQRHLVGLYLGYATAHLARLLELHRQRQTATTLREELLPSRLPRVPGVRLAVRHGSGPLGGGDWYDALPLPDGALGLAVGSVTGSGPGAVAAMGRLRASLRAYAVMEGEDPVAVLSDLELLLRLTEPARSATALFAFAEAPPGGPGGPIPSGGPSGPSGPGGPGGPYAPGTPGSVPGAYGTYGPGGATAARRIVLAGAGHCPPLIIGDRRTEYVETSLSAPLGMLACWEAPSVELAPAPGETLLLYSDGLLRRTGEPMDRAFARLHAAAAGVPRAVRHDPDALVDHVLRTLLPDGIDDPESPEDVVLLAAYFE